MREVLAEVLAFVRAALPAPPAHVLEIGAGDGELAAELRAAGYDVRAIATLPPMTAAASSAPPSGGSAGAVRPAPTTSTTRRASSGSCASTSTR